MGYLKFENVGGKFGCKGVQYPKLDSPLLADPMRSQERSGVGMSEVNREVTNFPEPPGHSAVSTTVSVQLA